MRVILFFSSYHINCETLPESLQALYLTSTSQPALSHTQLLQCVSTRHVPQIQHLTVRLLMFEGPRGSAAGLKNLFAKLNQKISLVICHLSHNDHNSLC